MNYQFCFLAKDAMSMARGSKCQPLASSPNVKSTLNREAQYAAKKQLIQDCATSVTARLPIHTLSIKLPQVCFVKRFLYIEHEMV